MSIAIEDGLPLHARLTKYVTAIDLTADQLNHLFSAPVELIAAPGANKITICEFVLDYRFGSVEFTPDSAKVYIGPSQQVGNVTINGTNDYTSSGSSHGGVSGIRSDLVNQPVMLADLFADSTTPGDGTALVIIEYSIMDLAP